MSEFYYRVIWLPLFYSCTNTNYDYYYNGNNNKIENAQLNDKLRRRRKIVDTVIRAKLTTKKNVELEEIVPTKFNELIIQTIDGCSGIFSTFDNLMEAMTVNNKNNMKNKLKSTMINNTVNMIELIILTNL